MEPVLAAVLNDEDAFRLVAAVVRGADWSGFGPMELTNGKFVSIPALKAKAISFAAAKPDVAAAAIKGFGLHIPLATFVSKYF